jgi:AraC-like DNA-binding protein
MSGSSNWNCLHRDIPSVWGRGSDEHRHWRFKTSQAAVKMRDSHTCWPRIEPNAMKNRCRPSKRAVEGVIQCQVLRGTCSLKTVAESLSLSPRSLQRHLSSEGQSFSELLADARLSLACRLLEETDAPVAAVGRKIGYTDPSNFGRAFRQWCGVTPLGWRERTQRDCHATSNPIEQSLGRAAAISAAALWSYCAKCLTRWLQHQFRGITIWAWSRKRQPSGPASGDKAQYPAPACQSALNRDPLSAPKIDPLELSWPGAAQSPCNAAAAGQRGFGLRYARFLKRQLSFPVSTISQ